MAKNVGLIKFTGSLGDLVSYERNGKQVIQRKGGFDGKRIKTEDRYEEIRKRQTEFGKCAQFSALLKRTFNHYLAYIPTPMVYNFIQSQVMAVKNCDLLSAKGEKTFEKGLRTIEGANLFKQFRFNATKSIVQSVKILVPFDMGTGSITFEKPIGLKKGGSVYGVELFVLSGCFDPLNFIVGSSGLHLLNVSIEEYTLSVSIPEELGSKLAFLCLIRGEIHGSGVTWFRDKENVFGVVGFEI